jgi:hypothetical protein
MIHHYTSEAAECNVFFIDLKDFFFLNSLLTNGKREVVMGESAFVTR